MRRINLCQEKKKTEQKTVQRKCKRKEIMVKIRDDGEGYRKSIKSNYFERGMKTNKFPSNHQTKATEEGHYIKISVTKRS